MNIMMSSNPDEVIKIWSLEEDTTSSVNLAVDPKKVDYSNYTIPITDEGVLDNTKGDFQRPITILSCYGGGVRSIIPLTIIAKFEELTDTPTHQLFDYMGGTSAGGMLTLALTTPSFEEGAVRPHQWTAAQLKEDHQTMMREIFPREGFWSRLTSWMTNPFSVKYDEIHRNRVIWQYLGPTLLKDALTNIAIPSVMVHNHHRHVFTRHEARTSPYYLEITMEKVCRAATAAPTYFRTEGLNTHYDEAEIAFTDAGLACNNPVMTTFNEAIELYGKNREYQIISLGTGRIKENFITREEMNKKGWASYLKKLIEYMGHSNNRFWDLETSRLAQNLGSNLVNINVEIDPKHFDLDNAEEQNIREMQAIAEAWCDNHTDYLDEICHGTLGFKTQIV